MTIESFSVQNVKCGGCVSNIEQGLATLPGVTQVTVDISSGKVDVNGDQLERKAISDKLAALGYPEK